MALAEFIVYIITTYCMDTNHSACCIQLDGSKNYVTLAEVQGLILLDILVIDNPGHITGPISPSMDIAGGDLGQ